MKREDRAGLYITVIVHLTVIIILLICQITAGFKKFDSFVIDFSREEAIEKEKAEERQKQEEEAFDEMISRRVEEMIAGNTGANFRNVAVDRSALKDDRGTNAEELYKENERLQKEMEKIS